MSQWYATHMFSKKSNNPSYKWTYSVYMTQSMKKATRITIFFLFFEFYHSFNNKKGTIQVFTYHIYITKIVTQHA